MLSQDQIIKRLIAERIKLLGYIHAIVRDPHLAEDIFQELTVLAMHAPDIQDEQHLMGWSRKTAQYKSMETLRKRRQQALTLDADVLELCDSTWAALDHLDWEDQLHQLNDCMDQLTPRARRLVRLKYVDGLSGQQIADSISNKLTSVYGALSRIHNQLNDCLKNKQPADA